jgi:hypothetical protein
MIPPSQILSWKERLIVGFAVRFCRIQSDTLIYLCRDLGLQAGKIRFLIEFYYEKSASEAKFLALSSPAWGEKSKQMLQLNEEGFAYLEDQKNQTKKRKL